LTCRIKTQIVAEEFLYEAYNLWLNWSVPFRKESRLLLKDPPAHTVHIRSRYAVEIFSCTLSVFVCLRTKATKDTFGHVPGGDFSIKSASYMLKTCTCWCVQSRDSLLPKLVNAYSFTGREGPQR